MRGFKRSKKVAVDDSFHDEDLLKAPVQPRPRRSRRRLLWIVGGVITIVALAVGLGAGLGLGLNRDDDDDSSASASTAVAALPTGTVTNRTFWQPAVNSTWQIVLLNPIVVDSAATKTTPDVEVFDIDLFTNNQSTITKLHDLNKKVICYFSAGSYEPGRPDSSEFVSADEGKVLDGWPGEKWLRLNSTNVRKIMTARIKLASDKGCDAIDPDNVDGYSNDNGLGLTEADSIDYMKFLSEAATGYNMSIGLKNAGAIISDVLSFTHFSVNEQCVQYDECTTFEPYTTAGKPVFNIEYPKGTPNSVSAASVTNICSRSGNSEGAGSFSSVIKNLDLDGWVEYCDSSTATTTTA